jgi:hypothetical protein
VRPNAAIVEHAFLACGPLALVALVGSTVPADASGAADSAAAFGFGANVGAGLVLLPEERELAGTIDLRPGIHFRPPWSTWLDLRVGEVSAPNITLTTVQGAPLVRAMLGPIGLESGVGVAYIWRTIEDGGTVRLSRVGLAIPVRVLVGRNLSTAAPGVVFSLDVTVQRYDTGYATWSTLGVGWEW